VLGGWPTVVSGSGLAIVGLYRFYRLRVRERMHARELQAGLEAARLGAIATFGPEGSTVMPSVLPAQVMLDAPLRSPADPPGPASSSSRPQAGYSIPSRPPAATSPETTMVAWAVD
jgi:hypothetical protein